MKIEIQPTTLKTILLVVLIIIFARVGSDQLLNFVYQLNPMEMISIVIAVISLGFSFFTLWVTYLYRGTVKMTRPTTIFFGPDGKDGGSPKVYLRTLLFSTSQIGQVIESMHVKLYRGESVQTFNIWVYGERIELVRGSGLYVGKEGVSYNHHFLMPKNETTYEFLYGKYKLEVYASLLKRSLLKCSQLNLKSLRIKPRK